MEFIIGLLIGILLGLIVHKIRMPKYVGHLRIDRSDPDSPYLFLELSESFDHVVRSEYVTLKVDTRSYISQK